MRTPRLSTRLGASLLILLWGVSVAMVALLAHTGQARLEAAFRCYVTPVGCIPAAQAPTEAAARRVTLGCAEVAGISPDGTITPAQFSRFTGCVDRTLGR